VGCWSSPRQKGRAATADSGSVVLGQPSSQNSRSPTVATVPDRPLRPRRRRFGTLLQQLECGVWERTPVRCLQVALFGRLPRRAGAACTWLLLIRPAVRPLRGPTYRYECASAPPRTTSRHHTRYYRAHPRQIVRAQRAVRLRASSAGRFPNTSRGIRVSTAANAERTRGTAYPIRPPKNKWNWSDPRFRLAATLALAVAALSCIVSSPAPTVECVGRHRRHYPSGGSLSGFSFRLRASSRRCFCVDPICPLVRPT